MKRNRGGHRKKKKNSKIESKTCYWKLRFSFFFFLSYYESSLAASDLPCLLILNYYL